MRFAIEQRYAGPPADVIRAYTTSSLYVTLGGLTRIGRPDVLDVVPTDRGLVVVRLRHHFTAEVPRAALAVVDPAKLTWVDETTYDPAALTATTRLLPDHYPDRISGTASSRFEVGAGGAGTVRRTTGEVKVRVPLVGGKVERAIVDGLREHVAEEAPRVDDWVRAAAG